MPTIHQKALGFVKSKAPPGDVTAILAAFDDYGTNHEFLMNVGPEKGPMLTAMVAAQPEGGRVLELGCFCGYSSILIGSALPSGATLTGIEIDPDSVAIARQTVEYAGLSDRVEIIEGGSSDMIPTLTGLIDLVFLDHWKDLYKTDLIAIESNNLLRVGSTVFADNVGPLFNPEEYLEYVNTSGHYDTKYHKSHIEYTNREDGVEISVYRGK